MDRPGGRKESDTTERLSLSVYLRMLLLPLRTQVQRVFTQVVNLLAHGPGSPVEQHGV